MQCISYFLSLQTGQGSVQSPELLCELNVVLENVLLWFKSGTSSLDVYLLYTIIRMACFLRDSKKTKMFSVQN